MTTEDKIREIERDQEDLRKEIDRMPRGWERERKIDHLFVLHDEIMRLRSGELAPRRRVRSTEGR